MVQVIRTERWVQVPPWLHRILVRRGFAELTITSSQQHRDDDPESERNNPTDEAPDPNRGP